MTSKEYRTISQIAGPLVFVEKTEPIGYNEIAIVTHAGRHREEGPGAGHLRRLRRHPGVRGNLRYREEPPAPSFLGETMKMPVSKDMLGRILSGSGEPLDGGPAIMPEKRLDINGAAINPWARDSPSEFIQTGISTIDGMNTLVRGQKLPIFSALRICRTTRSRCRSPVRPRCCGSNEEFAVVFAAMGITNEEAQYFMKDFERTGALKRAVVFMNLADDPAIERIITPASGADHRRVPRLRAGIPRAGHPDRYHQLLRGAATDRRRP